MARVESERYFVYGGVVDLCKSAGGLIALIGEAEPAVLYLLITSGILRTFYRPSRAEEGSLPMNESSTSDAAAAAAEGPAKPLGQVIAIDEGRSHGAEQMKRSRFSEEQIIGILREGAGASTIREVCAKPNVSEVTCPRGLDS